MFTLWFFLIIFNFLPKNFKIYEAVEFFLGIQFISLSFQRASSGLFCSSKACCLFFYQLADLPAHNNNNNRMNGYEGVLGGQVGTGCRTDDEIMKQEPKRMMKQLLLLFSSCWVA